MSTLNTGSHTQGRVVGNRIIYGNNNSFFGGLCSFCPRWGPYSRSKTIGLLVVGLFLFVVGVANLALGQVLGGLVFLTFGIVTFSIVTMSYLRNGTHNPGMLNVTYNQVPVQAIPGQNQAPGQAIPGQNQGPVYPVVHIHGLYPSQQHTAQPYPMQPPSALPYPAQGYPSHLHQAQPPAQIASVAAVPAQGVQAPVQSTGDPLVQPAPPTYDEAMDSNKK